MQLSILGYVLVPIFQYNHWWLVALYGGFMLMVASMEAVQRPSYSFAVGPTVGGSFIFLGFLLRCTLSPLGASSDMGLELTERVLELALHRVQGTPGHVACCMAHTVPALMREEQAMAAPWACCATGSVPMHSVLRHWQLTAPLADYLVHMCVLLPLLPQGMLRNTVLALATSSGLLLTYAGPSHGSGRVNSTRSVPGWVWCDIP